MARIPDIERRLLNWARWWIANKTGSIGFALSRREEHRVDGEGYDAQAWVPTVDCEADETEAAIGALDPQLSAAVREYYLSGKGVEVKARKLGCSRATLYARIDQAHRALAGWFADQHRARGEERARVEKLQRAAAAAKAGSFHT